MLLEDGEVDSKPRYYEGDVVMVESGSGERSAYGGVATASVPAIAVEWRSVPQRQRWVELIDTSDGNRVVTVIEILSPGNKTSSKLNQKYRKKLWDYFEAGVSIVEIDLIRSSRSRLLVTDEDIALDRRAAYYTCVNRARDPDRWMVYPMSLRDPLPRVPVPCRVTDPDVGLELQPVLDRVYLEGGHDDIDYTKPPEPPFSDADATWAAERLATAVR